MLIAKIFALTDLKGGIELVSSLDTTKNGNSDGKTELSQTVSPRRVDCIKTSGLTTKSEMNKMQNIITKAFDFILVVIYYYIEKDGKK